MQKTIKFIAEGMHCASCEKIIEKTSKKLKGVNTCKADYETEEITLTYNTKQTNKQKIFNAINKKGYTCSNIKNQQEKKKPTINSVLAIFFTIVGFMLIIYFFSYLSNIIPIPDLSQNISLSLLFVLGLITGFHCVTMCGGFVISYTTNYTNLGKNTYLAHAKYGISKTLSYTIMGALFGLLGSIVIFTPTIRGIAGIIAGLFLIIFGLNMLNISPILRKIRVKTPQFLSVFVMKKSIKHKSNPVVIGLLNGLMLACGPLQAIYIMAASTASMIEGAKMLLVFGLGTLPVMLSFGYITSFLSSNSTKRILKASGYIVIILGIIMFNEGLSLTGSGYDFNTISTSINEKVLSSESAAIPSKTDTNTQKTLQEIYGEDVGIATIKGDYQEIKMDVTRYGWTPDKFIIQKNLKVKWIINGKEINGCNNAIQVPKYNLEFPIKQGTQTIEFTPKESGVISWSCWMGMIPGTFIIKDTLDVNTNININTQEDIQKDIELFKTQETTAGICGGIGEETGRCGCGR